MLGQYQDVRAALAQRRQREREHRQPVVEVLAKAPSLDGRFQIFVGRGQDPDVDRLVACAPQPPHRPLLEHLEELRLESLGQEPDLVQEDRAAVGGLKKTRFRPPGVGEGATLEAEHLGLEQSFRNCGAVDVDERTVGSRSRAMNRAGQEPLAGPCLALDENRRQPARILLPGQEPRDLITNRLDARALTEQVRQVFHGSASYSPVSTVFNS